MRAPAKAPALPRKPVKPAKADPNHESYAYNWRSRKNLQRGKAGR